MKKFAEKNSIRKKKDNFIQNSRVDTKERLEYDQKKDKRNVKEMIKNKCLEGEKK